MIATIKKLDQTLIGLVNILDQFTETLWWLFLSSKLETLFVAVATFSSLVSQLFQAKILYLLWCGFQK